ncbi:MAG: phenylalanine--tRNA ligase subunit beta, partial [Thermoleophilia bacterium]|nr:phenylalanine--tRNA ligase subunit beta [Thermoleophilia bacterium]
MKVPVSWLREYVEFDVPVVELARRLVFTSCEVDRVVERGVRDLDGNLALFRIGRVLDAGKHPNADRLQLCQVDVGEREPRQIVCGAWNFGPGATVAVALPGALLPGAAEPLREAKLRGEFSRGMILSERELELGADHSGIMVLEEELEPGTPLADVVPLTETVLEIETLFNRPDLTGIYGIAREVAALTGGELKPPPGSDPRRAGDEPVDVRVEDPGGCPRYVGRLFRGARVAPSPLWLKARLLAADMRPIVNVVDVTNYVMLALGNPLHAFDHARLREGRIVVRRAREGEEIRTLDGEVRRLTAADLVIADAEVPVAIAGIMGGEDSEVRPDTTDLLLEAANFDALTLLRTSRRLRLRSESSTRWERGVDPHAAHQAAVYATELLVELTGARWTGHTDVHGGLPERPLVRLRPELTDRLTGMHFPVDEQRATLERLGFDVGGDLTVTVPTWRALDVTRPVDLVEEVARFRMEEVPSTLPERQAMFGQLTREQRLRRLVEDVLVGAGFHEAYTWTLVPAGNGRIELAEPYSVELAALRTDLQHGLLESARRNANAGVDRIALFELARVFLPDLVPSHAPGRGPGLPTERWHVAGIVDGGFFRAKGAVETLYRAFGVGLTVERADGPAARTPDGVIRELDEGWGYFELDVDGLFERVDDVPLYEDVITYPAVKQDLAFAVDEGVTAGELIAAAHEAAGPELRELR